MLSYEPIEQAYPPEQNGETVPSASKYGYHTNNRYQGYPPLMQDGRSIEASFQPQAEWNNQVLKQSGIQSNWEYRQYLANNAEAIMKTNWEKAANDIGYFRRYSEETIPPPSQQRHPYDCYENNDRGHDLKQLYLTREELNQRKQQRPLS
jgi:hypothetical protein